MMLYSFSTKRPLSGSRFFPLDFYRFHHTEECVDRSGQKSFLKRPLWIVGVSPFDCELSDDEGHVVHLAPPRFTARWSMNEQRMTQIDKPDYIDEDLQMILHEVIPIDGTEMPADEWLLEAICAIGYSRGLITMAPTEDVH